MSENKDENVKLLEEKRTLGFCNLFSPQVVPRRVGPNKELLDYKPYYFQCLGDKCEKDWCYVHGVCKYQCEHESTYHLEEGEYGEEVKELLEEGIEEK